MSEFICQCGFGEEYFTIEKDKSICTVCGGTVVGHGSALFEETSQPPGKRVVIVDDQPFFRKRVQEMLVEMGYEVQEAAEGIEAVYHVARALRSAGTDPTQKVDLVLLDLTMPGLIDGFQTLGVLKAIDEELPVIILTSSPPTQELLKKLGQLKAKKYLNKASKDLTGLLRRNLTAVL